MSETIAVQTFEVRKEDWSQTRLVDETLSPDLAEGEVIFRVDRFALTANNISYCSAGDALGYWGFFPAEEGWGRIPTMGYADVIASAHPDLAVGERVWGFFPMSTHLKIQAGKVRPDQFVDVSPHRAEYAPVYAQFTRSAANPIYDPAREDQDSLLRGLFMTSWLCEDFMHDNETYGADAYLISSASSKTSIALGFTVKDRGEKRAIGLTSAGNVEFCESLGCYDEIVTYADLASLDPGVAVVLVDMAGNADVISQLHHHYSDNMKYSCRIGATHYDKGGAVEGLPGATPEFFFAPTQVQKRGKEWGAEKLMQQLGMSFVRFREFSDNWLQVKRGHGVDRVSETYQSVLAGSANPREGQILSFWDAD